MNAQMRAGRREEKGSLFGQRKHTLSWGNTGGQGGKLPLLHRHQVANGHAFEASFVIWKQIEKQAPDSSNLVHYTQTMGSPGASKEGRGRGVICVCASTSTRL